jgi:hypothetical protein
VIAVPGLTPRFPVMTEGPVFVTVEPASTAKLPAVPSGTAVAALALPANATMSIVVSNATTPAKAAPRRLRFPVGAYMESFMIGSSPSVSVVPGRAERAGRPRPLAECGATGIDSFRGAQWPGVLERARTALCTSNSNTWGARI